MPFDQIMICDGWNYLIGETMNISKILSKISFETMIMNMKKICFGDWLHELSNVI